MSELQPITHEEQQLAAVLQGKEPLKPILHEDLFYAALAKGEVPTAKPITRKEMFLKAIAEKGLGGGGTPINNQDKTITENGEYTADAGYTGLGKVTVDVATSGGDTSDSEQLLIDIIERKALGDIVLPSGLTQIGPYAFYEYVGSKKITIPEGCTTIRNDAFYGSNCEVCVFPSTLVSIENDAFNNVKSLRFETFMLPKKLQTLGDRTFRYGFRVGVTASELNETIKLPAAIQTIGVNCFYGNNAISVIIFEGTPTSISSSAFSSCTNLLTINVPWAEGEVAGAPWGATNATINYNYTGE